MNVSEVDIASIALSYIGEGTIESFTEEGNPAAVCKLHYRFAVAETLQAFPWPDAKARATLTALADSFVPALWTYAYALPADCLRPRFLVRVGDPSDPRYRQKFERYSSYLVTNLDAAGLVYTSSAVTVDKFSPLLIDAIAWKLATKIAMPITRTSGRLSDAMAGFQRALSAAETSAANEEPDNVHEYDPEWLADRGYSSFGFPDGIIDRG